MKDKNYTVWVGGTEVTDELVTVDEAFEMVQYYQARGYDDVEMEKIDD